MHLRLRSIRRRSRTRYRLILDVADPGDAAWGDGDCRLRVDIVDRGGVHACQGRGLTRHALETYRLAPDDPPATSEARLLWEIGQVVHAYVGRLFAAGVLCPFGQSAADDVKEPSE
jgi:hypothetical protein